MGALWVPSVSPVGTDPVVDVVPTCVESASPVVAPVGGTDPVVVAGAGVPESVTPGSPVGALGTSPLHEMHKNEHKTTKSTLMVFMVV